MDADGTRSKGIARSLRKIGIKASISHIVILLSDLNMLCNTAIVNKTKSLLLEMTETVLSPRWLPLLGSRRFTC